MLENSPLPLYHRIASTLATRINTGVYRPGNKFATEADLAEEFGVSRITIRAALEVLSGQRLIERKRAKGTFVAEGVTPRASVQLNGNLEDILLQVSTAGTAEAEISMVAAPDDVAALLHVPAGTTVYRYVRLRDTLGDNPTPRAFVVNHLPIDIGGLFSKEDLLRDSLTRLLDAEPATRIGWGEERVYADGASEEVARRLGIPVGSPVLAMERVLYAPDGRPLDLVRIAHRADKYSYTVRLDRILSSLEGGASSQRPG